MIDEAIYKNWHVLSHNYSAKHNRRLPGQALKVPQDIKLDNSAKPCMTREILTRLFINIHFFSFNIACCRL